MSTPKYTVRGYVPKDDLNKPCYQPREWDVVDELGTVETFKIRANAQALADKLNEEEGNV